MRSGVFLVAMIGLGVYRGGGAQAKPNGPAPVCPVPETVTVTETFGGLTKGNTAMPTSTVSTTVTKAASTETRVKTVTDVITVLRHKPSTTDKDNKDEGHVVTAWTTITVHPHVNGSGVTEHPLTSESVAQTTTEFTTISSTEVITLQISSSQASNVPHKPSSKESATPYGNRTTTVIGSNHGNHTTSAPAMHSGTGSHAHFHRLTTSLAGANGSKTDHHSTIMVHSSNEWKTVTVDEFNRTVVMTLPWPTYTLIKHNRTLVHKTSTCTDTTSIHKNGSHSTEHPKTDNGATRSWTTSFVPAHNVFRPLNVLSYPGNTDTQLPTLVTAGITPFPMASLPPNVTRASVHVHGNISSAAQLAKRSASDWVYATINGKLVSWINNYTPSAMPLPSSQVNDTTTGSAAMSSWVFPTPHMPVPVSALVSEAMPTASSSASDVYPVQSSANLYGNFSLGPVPQTTASLFPTSTGDSPAAFCTATELGNFVIGFEDLPTYGEPKNKTIYPPVPTRYHNLFWSQGFTYLPPPTDPFPPHSGHQLAAFIVNQTANVHPMNVSSPDISHTLDYGYGMFGAGPNTPLNAYWFNIQGAYVGCYDVNRYDCEITAQGWRYNNNTGEVVAAVEQFFIIPMCHGNQTCALRYIEFHEDFTNLTALQITANSLASKKPLSWYIDDIELQWSNDTCAANEIRNSDH